MGRLFFNKLSLPVYGLLLLLISGSPFQTSIKTSAFYQSFDYERHLALTLDKFTDGDVDSVFLPHTLPDYDWRILASAYQNNNYKSDLEDRCLTHAIRGPPIEQQTRGETFYEFR